MVERDPNAPTERTERAARMLADAALLTHPEAWRHYVEVFNEHDIKIAELENELESLRPREGR